MFFFRCSCLGRSKKSRESPKEANEPSSSSFRHRSLSRRSTVLASETCQAKSRTFGSLDILSKSESLDQTDKDGCISPVEPSESDLMSVASLAAWRPHEVSTGIRHSSERFGFGSPAPSVNLARLTMKPHLELNFSDLSPEPRLTINLDGTHHAYSHGRTYSDDPFAPPTPGFALAFGDRASADFRAHSPGPLSPREVVSRSLSQPAASFLPASRSRVSLLSRPASPEQARLPPILPSLPKIERLSLLDLSDWTSPNDGEARALSAGC